MESLPDHTEEADAAAGMLHQPELEFAATATSTKVGGGTLSARPALAAARKDEVQRTLGKVLAIRCDTNTQYAAPVVVMSQEDSNVYNVLERHFRRDFLSGAEKFWRQVRSELGVETWRPRVQGSQLKALQGARLPEFEQEFLAIQQTVEGLQDCLVVGSSPQAFMQDLRITVSQIQTWWDNRNRKADGGFKRPGPGYGIQAQANKRRALAGTSHLDQQQLLGFGSSDVGDQDLLHDSAAAAAALSAAAAAAATAGYIDMGAPDVGGGVRLPFPVNGLDQSAAATAPTAGPAAAGAGLGSAAAAAGAGGGGGLGTDLLNAAAAAAAAAGAGASNPLAPFLANPSGLLVLHVGGQVFRTTLNTLLAVQGSLFWQVTYGQAPPGVIQRLPGGEVFIDRAGAPFVYILEYLRACNCGDIIFPMPNDARELQALAREAYFYQLHELLHHVQHSHITPQPSTRTFYDTVYMETGFTPTEGPESFKDMERVKIVMMQQLNHIIHDKAQQGFAVDQMLPGAAHKAGDEDSGSGSMRNLYYHVLLKKVVPLLPQEMTVEMDDGQQNEEEDEQQGEQQQQQQ